jgi:hypothetical protein
MFDKFYNDLIWFATDQDNKNKDGTINWNFVDSEMYMKWSIYLDGETYNEFFDKAADIVEGVDV